MITDEQLAELRTKYPTLKHVRYNGHDLVFRAGTRFETKEFKRNIADDQTRLDADDQIAQKLIVAFDDSFDVAGARKGYLALLETPGCGMASSSKDIGGAIGQLLGMAQNDDLKDSGGPSSASATPQANSQTA